MAEINEFDDFLKNGLSNLGNDISPGSWDSFAEKLSAANGPSPLEEPTTFDDIIRDRMERMEVTADANYWDALESKIDEELNVPEISDEALDQLATDGLSNLYIPYNPTHWTLLSHRLEEEFNVRRKIFNYKATEFSLMVLLLITIVQFMPSYPSINDKNIVTAEAQAALSEKDVIVNSSSDPISELIANARLIIDTEKTIDFNTDSNLIAEKIENSKKQPATIIIISEDNNAKDVASITDKTITTATEKEITQVPLEDGFSSPVNQSTSSLTELPTTILPLNHNPDWSNIGLLKKFPKKVIVRLGAMTSADLNYINTSSTDRYKDNGYQQFQMGYGGGITLDLNYEKVTLSTGLIYHRINYYPHEEINIAGSFANGYQSRVFDAANLNLLTIPLNLQFQINDPDKKWKIHAVAGTALNVLALNHYNVTVNNIGSSTSRFSGPVPEGLPVENTPDEILREADIAGEGLFEGGTFKRNHFFTANLGIGVERFISPRWSLFVQPVYQHEIFGKNLGLNRDRIHTFSIQMGAKSTFK